jgi:Flp pilus assembly protein TadD
MHSNRTLFPIACAAFLALPSTLLTKKQMSIWVDSESLYSYLLDRVGDHPYRDRLLADLVGFYRAEKRYPEAIRELNELIARNPRDAQAYAYRAMLWNTLEDKNKARADLQRALELDPNLPGARELGEQI